jgi:hypothetical protein
MEDLSTILCVLYRVSSQDTGKTMVDDSLGKIISTCERITWLLGEGEQWLKPEYRSEFQQCSILIEK